jgi:formylglycine-generating enzyme required for sulfatase activity
MESTLSILPPPFAWCPIPAGYVTLLPRLRDDTDDYIAYPEKLMVFLKAFDMAKYPITNAQFACFIAAGGYQTKRWWTQAGWAACRKGYRYIQGMLRSQGTPWSAPHFWHEPRWNQPDHPVVGISWYEAYAFCRWLRELSDEPIVLPSEFHWQRAAQDETVYPSPSIAVSDRTKTGPTFPWGDTWDGRHCNHNVDGVGLGGTTPVRHYEGLGESFFGVVDMAGNVWEWCFTKASGILAKKDTAEGSDDRVIRGGSWREGIDIWKDAWETASVVLPFYTDERTSAVALYAATDIGFRIARIASRPPF